MLSLGNTSGALSSVCIDKSIILVTGATGWVGRSVIHELQKHITPVRFNEIVFAFASKHGSIRSTAYGQGSAISIPVFPLSELARVAHERRILLIHTAFLTKDRLRSYGSSSFVDTNRRITSIVCEAVRGAEHSRVVEISSGAAALCAERGESSLGKAADPYGFLKLSEERLLAEITETQVLRIYALSGRFIRDPQAFALGDFLISALKGVPIRIQAKGPVIRGYVSASDVAQTALCWLMSEYSPLPPISAVSHVVALTTLAASISTMFKLPSVVSDHLAEAPNSYSCSPALFLALMQSFSLKPMSMSEQIIDTKDGILTFLAGRGSPENAIFD